MSSRRRPVDTLIGAAVRGQHEQQWRRIVFRQRAPLASDVRDEVIQREVEFALGVLIIPDTEERG